MQTEPAGEKPVRSEFRDLLMRGMLVIVAIIFVSGFGVVACSDLESRPSIDSAISQTMTNDASAKPTAVVQVR